MAYVGARVVYALGTEVSRARELGSYQLVERLGQGGMGEVWRAKHRMLARPAAIKLIRPSVDAGCARRRLRGGAAPLRARSAGHRQPSIAAHGRTVRLRRGRRRHLLLRDGAARRTRRRRAREAHRAGAGRARHPPAPPDLPLAVGGRVMRSRAPRHQAREHLSLPLRRGLRLREGPRFRHRQGRRGFRSETGVALTRENVVHGTPAFIAPEQALGESTLDGRADIYATGCVAYWLLTGELVFTADTPLALLMHHAHTAPTPPSARTELPIPAALDQLVLSCLAKDPGGSAADGKRIVAPACDSRRRKCLDRGPGSGVVGAVPASPGPSSTRIGSFMSPDVIFWSTGDPTNLLIRRGRGTDDDESRQHSGAGDFR